MVELQGENYTDIIKYHKALSEFLSVSNATSNGISKRALKAREKLLKLSPAQFYELSTDVYDELQRRIDESQEQPNFLLPKSTFQPKRNEARQTLGSLQQKRFRDLVSDIHYEIERRNLHISHGPAEVSAVDFAAKEANGEVNLDKKRISNDPSKNGVVSLQSATVIPTKVELAWSSDEEEEQNADIVDRHLSSQIADKNHISSSSNKGDRLLDNESEKHRTPKKPTQLNRGLSMTKNINKDREIELLLEEGTKMDKTITDLEHKNTLLQNRIDKFENEVKELKKTNESAFLKISDLETTIQTYKQEIDRLETSQRGKQLNGSKDKQLGHSANESELQINSSQQQIEDLKKEVTEWRSKYEKSHYNNIESSSKISLLSNKSLAKFCDQKGLIPLKLVVLLHESLQSSLVTIDKIQSSKTIDIDSLFGEVSKISKISGKISSFAVHSPNSELIRAAVSHAITSTRYYSMYFEALPKLVIESAISEVAFAVCELISEVKLIDDEKDYTFSDLEDGYITNNNTQSKPSLTDISPVRPLRMAKKADSTTSSPKQSPKVLSTDKIAPRLLNVTNSSSPFNDGSVKKDNNDKVSNPEKPLNLFKTKVSPLSSRFINNDSNDIGKTNNKSSGSSSTPVKPLRNSSSSNIMSKVRQFEQQQQQQENTSQNSTPERKPHGYLPESVVGKFSDKKALNPEPKPSPSTLRSIDNSGPQLESYKATTSNTGNGKAIDGVDSTFNEDRHDDTADRQEEVKDEGLNGRAQKRGIETETIDHLKNQNGFKQSSEQKNTVPDQKNNVVDSNIKIEDSKSNNDSTINDKEAQKEHEKKDSEAPLSRNDDSFKEKEKSDKPLNQNSGSSRGVRSGASKEVTAEDFDVGAFDIEDPDNTLSELLLYLEHQTVQVIATIQTFLALIKAPETTRGDLRSGSKAIITVISQMVEATSNSMNQTRNAQLREHGVWVVEGLEDSGRRMEALCKLPKDEDASLDEDFADKHLKQRLAGISFDVAKCTKELVKTVEEANLKEEIAHLDARLAH